MDKSLLNPVLHQSLKALCGSQYMVLGFQDGKLKQFVNPKPKAPRHLSSLSLIQQAQGVSKLPDGILILNTSDKPILERRNAHLLPYPVVSYCTSANHLDWAIPDFIFEGWPEAGISSYRDLYERFESVNFAQWEHRLPYLYWSGTATNMLRAACIEQYHHDPRVSLHLIRGSNNLTKSEVPRPKGYAPFDAVSHFKYLLDLPGNGYSGRAKLLLLTGGFLIRLPHQDGLLEYWESSCPVQLYDVLQTVDHLKHALDQFDQREAEFKERARWAMLWARFAFHKRSVYLALNSILTEVLASSK